MKVATNALSTLIEEISSIEMSEKCLKWLTNRFIIENDQNLKLYIGHFINSIFKTSKSRNLLNSNSYLYYIDYQRKSNVDQHQLLKFINQGLKINDKCDQLWLQKLDIEPSIQNFNKAIELIPINWEIYERYIKFMLENNQNLITLFESLSVISLHGSKIIENNMLNIENQKLTIHDRVLKSFIELNDEYKLVNLNSNQLFSSSIVNSPSPMFYNWLLVLSDKKFNDTLIFTLFENWRSHPLSNIVDVSLKQMKWLITSQNNSTKAFQIFNSTLIQSNLDANDRLRLEEGWQAILDGKSLEDDNNDEVNNDNDNDSIMEESV